MFVMIFLIYFRSNQLLIEILRENDFDLCDYIKILIVNV